jgi:CHASE3 domain sensor protein
MSTKIENIVRPGYALAFILIIISYALFFYSLKLSNDARHEIDRTHASIKTLEEVSAAFRDIEVGMRGYLLVV